MSARRIRLDGSLREDNKKFFESLREETLLNKGVICDLAFDILRRELKTKTIQDLIRETKKTT